MKNRLNMPIAAFAVLSLAAAACSSDGGTSAAGCTSEDLGGSAFAPVVDTSAVTAAAGNVTPVLGQGDKPVVKVGWFGDITGGNSSITVGSMNGAELAIEQANEAGNLAVTIEFEAVDNKDASEATAPAIEQGFIADDSVVGVIGGAFSGETLAVGELFSEAGLTHISPSATNPDITTKGWPFFRLLNTDALQGAKIAELIADLGCTKVAVVNDRSDYGLGLADLVKGGLGDIDVALDEGIEPTTDYTSVVDSVLAADVELLFYGGYVKEASLLLKQLREKGYEGIFMSGDGSKETSLIEGAGAANAEGAVLTCPCGDVTTSDDPEAQAFVESYTEAYGGAPTIYAAEGYDGGNLMVAAIDAADDDGTVTREEIFTFFDEAEGIEGITKSFTWDETGEVEGGTIYSYVVRDGEMTVVGPIE